MTDAVFDFKSIRRKLNRQEQKAEFEEKNPPIPDTSMYGWPYGVAVPYGIVTDEQIKNLMLIRGVKI
jgi:hypothetical protein